jgi:hypothetical protein
VCCFIAAPFCLTIERFVRCSIDRASVPAGAGASHPMLDAGSA